MPQQPGTPPGPDGGSAGPAVGGMLRSGSTAAAEQRAKNIEVLQLSRQGVLLKGALRHAQSVPLLHKWDCHMPWQLS